MVAASTRSTSSAGALCSASIWVRRRAAIAELARSERINPSYVSRVLRLTLLAPDIVEAVLDGRQPEDVTLATAMAGVPVVWEQQRRVEKLVG